MENGDKMPQRKDKLENGQKDKEIWTFEQHMASRHIFLEDSLGEQPAPVTSPSMIQFKLVEGIEEYLEVLIEEHLDMQACASQQLSLSELLFENAIETMKKGIDQYKATFCGERTPINPDMQESFSSLTLKPCQQQETSHGQREGWSAELHEKFLCCLEHMTCTQDARKRIRELMKVEELTNHEHQQSGRRNGKELTVELCNKFRDCVERLGGPTVPTLQEILVAMNDPTLSMEDIEELVVKAINWDDYDLEDSDDDEEENLDDDDELMAEYAGNVYMHPEP